MFRSASRKKKSSTIGFATGWIVESLERRVLLSVIGTNITPISVTPTATDFDGNGIMDTTESELLTQFDPYLIPNSSEDFIPISVSEFLTRSNVLDKSGNVLVTSPTPSSVDPTNAAFGNLDIVNQSTPSTAQDRASARANARIYGRVSQPSGWPTGVYSVQYYALLVRNATNGPSNDGDHAGDMICVDFTVDDRNQTNPQITTAIYHNHGRQFFVEAKAIQYLNGHPVVYLEKGTNETWPTTGSPAQGGWPAIGVTTNDDLEDQVPNIGAIGLDPAEYFREHLGLDVPILAPVVNLGAVIPNPNRPGTVLMVDNRTLLPGTEKLYQDEARFLDEFPNQWGNTDYTSQYFSFDFGPQIQSPWGPYYTSPYSSVIFSSAA